MIGKKFIQNNIIYFSSVVFGGLIGYLFNFVVAHRLAVSQFGEFQGVLALMSIISIILSAFSYFMIKYSSVFALHNDIDGQLRFIRFLKKKFKFIVLASVAALVCLLPLAKQFLHLEDYGGLIIIGLTMLVSFYSSFYINSLQGWSNFTVISAIGVVSVLVKFASGYLATLFYPNSSSVMVSVFISAVASWLVAKYYIEKKWKSKVRVKTEEEESWKEKYFSGISFKKSFINILFFSAGLTLLGTADILLLRNVADAQIVGYYAALSVLGKALYSFNFAFIGVSFPDACSEGYYSQPAKIQSVIGSYIMVFLISIPAIAVFYLFPNLIISTLFGNKYVEVVSNLWLFGIMGFCLSIITLEAKLALARHDFRSTYILLSTILVFSAGIYYFHSDLRSIAIAVSLPLAIGWAGILLLNWNHRIHYASKI
jgi:O-antigen/teichoic acid export membrane protein